MWSVLRVVWLALFVTAIIVEYFGLASSYERASRRPFAHVGLGWRSLDGAVTLRTPTTKEARDAGIRDGQTLIAVDGHPVGNKPADMRVADALLVGPEGSAVTLTTRNPQGRIEHHRLTRSEEHADALYRGSGINNQAALIIQLIFWALPDIMLLAVSLILMRGRRREALPILLAFSFVLSVIGSTTNGLLFSGSALIMTRLVLNAIGAGLLAIALVGFPDGRIDGRFRKCVVVLALVAAASQLLVGDTLDPLVLAAGFIAGLVLPIVALLLRARAAPPGPQRQQLRFTLFGFALGALFMLLAMASGLLADSYAYTLVVGTWLWILSMVFSVVGVLAIVGGLLLSLVRYRLYDVDAVISRSAAYGLMTVGFVAAFAGLENILEQAAQTYFAGNAGKAAGAISAALAAGLIGPMHNRIHRWTENRFRKGLVAMRRELPNTIDDLRETATFDELAAAVEPAVARGVSAEWVRLRPPQFLDAADIDVRGELERPIATNDGRALSLLEVGPRPDGSPHGKDEREAVDALVEPLARALSVIERREAKEQALDRRIGALEAAIRTLTGKKAAAST